MNSDLLFCRNGYLSEFLDARKNKISEEIENYDSNYILNVSEADFCQYFFSKYSLETPMIKEDEIVVYTPNDVKIDVSNDPGTVIIDRNRPFYVKGTEVTIDMPFEGDVELFHYRPSSFTTVFPRAIVKKQIIQLVYRIIAHNSERLNESYKSDSNLISKYLEWVREDVEDFNKTLIGFIKNVVTQRKKKLLKDMDLVKSLSIPIEKRGDLPVSFSVPSIRKEPKISLPKATKELFKPEPTLAIEEYKNILEIIWDMSLVMERSPQTFSKLKEEEIRDHFLMILNAQYDGKATGETFNYEGKTDILIRHEGKNVFIAECKFWRGRKKLIEAIKQLLGYTSWRDTKTAILIFNKSKNFSTVLEKIDATAKSHNCYKRIQNLKSDKLENETTFSYIFHQPDDKNRELFLTVMAFDVPK